jgi:molybdenum storage protein
MTEIFKEGGGHRTHIKSPLMRESLMDRKLLAATDTQEVLPILPDVHVVHIGGTSILDRGKGAIVPFLDEVVRCRQKHKIILGVGGGARQRHTFHICLDLGIPTGGLAMVAGAVNEQNRYMVQALLAKHGGVVLHKDHYVVLPLWLASGMIPIISGMPPYHYWEPPTGSRRLPHFREDFGMFMVSEVLGAASMIFVKDEDGLYTADPKKDPTAEHIPSITAQELLDRDMPDQIIDRAVIENMIHARNTRKVQVINGLKPKMLRQALDGELVGTVITTDPQAGKRSKASRKKGVDDGR